jgi:hypothetical protein
MLNPDVETMLEQHHHEQRIERMKTSALIGFLYLYGAAALIFVIWLLMFPVSDEERFYSAACKYDTAELPAAIRATCAAIKAQE